jgi:hypothetical protein
MGTNEGGEGHSDGERGKQHSDGRRGWRIALVTRPDDMLLSRKRGVLDVELGCQTTCFSCGHVRAALVATTCFSCGRVRAALVATTCFSCGRVGAALVAKQVCLDA